MSYVSVELALDKKALKEIENLPDIFIYQIARQVLDYTVPFIPMKTGKMRKSTLSFGVHGSNKDYFVGTPIRYANRVWNLPDRGTNWNTPDTHPKWFYYAFRRYRKKIMDDALNKAKKG